MTVWRCDWTTRTECSPGAATRGDGTIGENVFQNALQIADVPRRLLQEVPGRISVVGEAYIPNSHFILLNNDREQAGDELYTGPRNTVAGGMRHSDPEEVARRGIGFFAYGLLHSDRPRGFTYHSEVMVWLAVIGLQGCRARHRRTAHRERHRARVQRPAGEEPGRWIRLRRRCREAGQPGGAGDTRSGAHGAELGFRLQVRGKGRDAPGSTTFTSRSGARAL